MQFRCTRVRDGDAAEAKKKTQAQEATIKLAGAATDLIKSPLAGLARAMRDLQDTDTLDEYTEGTVNLLIEKGRKDMAAAAESMISGEPLEFDLKAVRQTAAEMLTKTRTCAYVRALHTIMFSSCGNNRIGGDLWIGARLHISRSTQCRMLIGKL